MPSATPALTSRARASGASSGSRAVARWCRIGPDPPRSAPRSSRGAGAHWRPCASRPNTRAGASAPFPTPRSPARAMAAVAGIGSVGRSRSACRISPAGRSRSLPSAWAGQRVDTLPWGADGLWCGVVGDVGDTWAPGAAARLHRLRSAGVELVADLTVSYDLPLGLRLGLAQPLADLPAGGRPRP